MFYNQQNSSVYMQRKLNADFATLEALSEHCNRTLQTDKFQTILNELRDSIVTKTRMIYEELEVTPEFMHSQFKFNDYSEVDAVANAKRAFNVHIEENFIKRLSDKQLLAEHKALIKELSVLLEESNNNMLQREATLKYVLFENCILEYILENAFPKYVIDKICDNIKNLPPEYTMIYEQNAVETMTSLVEDAKTFTQIVSPIIFDRALTEQSIDINLDSSIGLSFKQQLNESTYFGKIMKSLLGRNQ